MDLRRGWRYTPWVQAFAAFIPDSLRGEAARRHCVALLDVAARWETTRKDFLLVRAAADLAESSAACRALLTAEGIGALDDPMAVEWLSMRGVRAATLTWNGDNAWASGCYGSGDGLTAAGQAALLRMQACGMVVDVSHLNTRGFWDVARASDQPFIASHSNAAAVMPHPRNLSDLQFCEIRDRGGLVGLNFYRPHLSGRSQDDFFDAFCRHLEHFLSLDGAHTVCIGTDFDGMDTPPAWDGMAVVQELYQQLLSRGYSPALLDHVFYANAWRFFRQRLA